MYFFYDFRITIQSAYNLISLISQVLIGPYLIHSVDTPLPHPFFPHFLQGVDSPTTFSKRGDLEGSQFLEEVAGKERGDYFHGGWGEGGSFYIKNKLKSAIFNDKKSSYINKNVFLCHS